MEDKVKDKIELLEDKVKTCNEQLTGLKDTFERAVAKRDCYQAQLEILKSLIDTGGQ